jgi:hypothetical protein
MKKLLRPILIALSATVLLNGCLGLHLGGGTHTTVRNNSQTYDVTLGQQLIDLQKAYDSGIITESQYNSQKKKLLKYYVAH